MIHYRVRFRYKGKVYIKDISLWKKGNLQQYVHGRILTVHLMTRTVHR